ncbi:Repeat domain-containing protein [Shimia gijangensis]|uniref:Repeat domain-containing protein n=1 Tax=Shimia gijangensis TaxID=1470563 RepID=A0A1M6CKD3_9RHOB|nr:CRTAC1 family protein [Shimia gijangensis]SHI61383.1 Repeat domain-containing protein [Shimia gijangensis]
MQFDFRVCVMSALVWAGATSADPLFLPESVPMHVYDGGWEHFVGGGVAVFDCDGDALPEMFVAGGSNPVQLLRNYSEVGGPLRFESHTPRHLAMSGATGAYPLDIDSDGHMDLAVLRVGDNQLFRGLGNCAFEPYAPNGFLGGAGWTTAFSATWEAEQNWPTLAFGNYVDRDDPKGPFGSCDRNYLFRPSGLSYVRGELAPAFCPLSMLFSDWSRTGRADLRISNDRHYYVSGGEEQLWQMASAPRLFSPEEGWKLYRLWGMGIASRDLNFDGLPEVFLSSMGDQRLQRMSGQRVPMWEDVPYEMGSTAHRPYVGDDGRPSTGWHVSFGDVQNDGLDDVFIAKGNVEQMPDSAMEDPNNLLLQNADGSFTEAGNLAGVASLHRGRGAAMVDFNKDGLLDLAVVNRRSALEVYRNVSTDTGNWLSLQLRQDAPNVNAVGAFIELRVGDKTMVREITVGGGHAGGVAGPEHFGLAKAKQVQVRVIWPDGQASDWTGLSINQRLLIGRSDLALQVTAY